MKYAQPKCRRCAEQPASIVLHAGAAVAPACSRCALDMLEHGWSAEESAHESQTLETGAEKCVA